MTKRIMLVSADELVIGDVYTSGYVIMEINDTPDGENLIVISRYKKAGRGSKEIVEPSSLHYIMKRDEHASHQGWHCYEDSAACHRV